MAARLIINFNIIVGLLIMSCSLHLPFFFVFFFQLQSSCAATLNNPAPQYNDAGPSHVIANQSFLELPRGLNLSILPSYNASDGSPLSYDLMFTAVMAGVADIDPGFFFAILSSPSIINIFNSLIDFSNYSTGFSLGFYFSSVDYFDPDYFDPASEYNVYLAVCAVLSGNSTNSSQLDLHNPNSTNSTNSTNSSQFGTYNISPRLITNAFVVPVWIANKDKPIKDWGKASLGVAAAAADRQYSSTGATTINILQLKEGDEIVWNVSNVGMMEMRDTGDLLIFSHNSSTSPSSKNVVWESFDTGTATSDILVQGQKLTVGGELRSNDSNYLARMEKGGLVLYLNINGLHLIDGTVNNSPQGLQQPPYWIFPMAYPSAPANASINHLISTAPCTNSPAFTVLDQLNDGGFTSSMSIINMDPGSICSNLSNSSIFRSSNADNAIIYWSFLRLENDGRLYVYTVYNPASGAQLAAPSVTKVGLDSNLLSNSSYSFSISQWGPECDVPMACGPVGVCTPGAKTLCSCPLLYFEPRNDSDFSQGCKRQTSLPVCTTGSDQHNIYVSTDFLELNSTASIFLFNGWSFNPTHAPLAHCKSLCSSTCSCNGFFYVQAAGHNNIDDSACFFFTDEFTLLNVLDIKTLFVFNYTSVSDFPQQRAVIARNYFTYLKVVGGSDSRSSTTAAATTALIVILPTIVAAILVIGMASIGAYLLFRSRKRKSAQIRLQAEEEKELQDILPLLPSRFSYKDLHEATKGFSNLLGAGGCGSVYSGMLWDGRKVAVKVLQVVLRGAEQSRQFLAEVGTIGRTSHHNIVRLYGFCWELSHRLLVYEYVERGSLDHWLFNVDDGLEASHLDWQTRYNVALGIGRGMHYLHEECEQPILHFDIKPQNILLGDDFVAKLADFGMSRLIQRDASSVVTGVRGTPGYIAPEWLSHGKVSKKSDIFSMGMVLLELVGGRKILDYSLLNSSLDPVEQEAWHLPSWGASKCAQGLMMELVDKRLHVCGFDREQAQRLIHIAFWCIHNDPTMRPSALTVVQWLEGIPPRRCPPFSTVIDAALDKPQATDSVYDESYHEIDHISMY